MKAVTITLSASRINRCFAEQTEQYKVLISLYKLLYGELLWDSIESVDGWPKAGTEVHKYIGGCFIRLDKAYHGEVLPGGLWLNKGWSADQNVGPWDVTRAPYVLAK